MLDRYNKVLCKYQVAIGSAYIAYHNTLPKPINGELSTTAGEPYITCGSTRRALGH
jgi:hypothetical protein